MPTLNDGTPVSAASSSEMTIEYSQLVSEVGEYLGMGRSSWSSLEETRIESIVKSGLRQVYYPQRSGDKLSYQWSWMRPEATIVTTAEYGTGTVEIVSGVVTLSGGTFPSWANEGEIKISSQVYTVNTRDSDTQVTLDDLSIAIAAGSTYSLGRPSYDLPAGFDGSFDGNLHYKTGDNTLYPSIKIFSPEVIREHRQNYNGSDRPLCASIQPKQFQASVGQRWKITFFPSPSQSYTFYGRYKVRPEMITAVNKFPLGGSAMAEVFLESCLAVAEKRFVEDSKIHQEEFRRLLKQAIDNDADSFSPDYLGYNSDGSDARFSDLNGRRFNNAIHSYEGVVYRD
mgnify:CR=1 FL=1